MKDNISQKNISNIMMYSTKVILILLCAFFIVPNTYQLLDKILAKEIITIKLIGDKEITLNINDKYEEQGIEIYINDQKTTMDYVTNGKVNTKKPGKYEITYTYKNNKEKRTINIIDNIKPTITLNDTLELSIFKGDTYLEPSFTAYDNVDGDITSKVTVSGKVDTTKIGKYIINYKVSDSSDNEYILERIINIKEKLPVVHVSSEVKDPDKKPITSFNNEIIDMTFNSTGIKIDGHYNSSSNTIKLIEINNKQEKNYNTTTTNNRYSSNIDLTNLPNGTYDLYLINDNEQKIINKLDDTLRIIRTKISNKLVTISYPNNNVRIDIKDFAYQYDILIDVGHGGTDSGASNNYIREKDLNLIVSNYEKKRYEQHGLKVLLSRTDDSYGLTAGNTNWIPVRRRAYAVGYYGVVSKIVYSNHHNSSPTKSYTGWEILVPAALTKTDLSQEHKIINILQQIYPLGDNHTRFYTRNYENDAIYNKINGEIYTFDDYYALNRIPYKLFNVKSVIYEGCYMSNQKDFDWYYLKDNWKKISEAKIKVYVESLGIKYIP